LASNKHALMASQCVLPQYPLNHQGLRNLAAILKRPHPSTAEITSWQGPVRSSHPVWCELFYDLSCCNVIRKAHPGQVTGSGRVGSRVKFVVWPGSISGKQAHHAMHFSPVSVVTQCMESDSYENGYQHPL